MVPPLRCTDAANSSLVGHVSARLLCRPGAESRPRCRSGQQQRQRRGYGYLGTAVGSGDFSAGLERDGNTTCGPDSLATSDNGFPEASWQTAVNYNDISSGDCLALVYAQNITGAPTAATLTVSTTNPPEGGSYDIINVGDFSGVYGNPDSVAAGKTNASALTATTNTVTTTGTTDLVIACLGSVGGQATGLTVAPGTGSATWHPFVTSTPRGTCAWAVVSPGTYSAAFSWTNGGLPSETLIASFLVNGSGGSGEQDAGAGTNNGTGIAAATFGAAVGSGHLLVGMDRDGNNTCGPDSLANSDNGSPEASWQSAVQFNDPSGECLALVYAQNVTGMPTTVTLTVDDMGRTSSGGAYNIIDIGDFSGVAGNLDVVGAGLVNASASSVTTSPVTVTGSHLLIACLGSVGGQAKGLGVSAGAGSATWKLYTHATPRGVCAYATVSTCTDSANFSWTGGALPTETMIASFFVTGGGVSGNVTAPAITAQPASATITAGQTATFAVTATGTAPLRYQRNQNGTAISGATSASYTTPAETSSANGEQFTVVVSNSAGSVTSSAAKLTVNAVAPGTLSSSASTLTFGNVSVGSSSVLGVTFTNTGSSNVTISNVSINGAGFNGSGVSTGQTLTPGQAATLNVTFAPAASGSVSGASVTVTSNASDSSLTVALTGTGVATASAVTLSWTASTSTVAGYDVYRATASSGPFTTPLNSSPVTTTQYVDSTVTAGQTYYYVVTAVSPGSEQSVDSNVASATIP